MTVRAAPDADVVVVGAGPVGLLLAGELRLGGTDVLVLDRLTVPMTESRASVLDAHTMELLDQRGLLAGLRHACGGMPPCSVAGHFGGIPLDLGGLATRYGGQWLVPQYRTEQVLAAWAGDLGARICRGHELCGLSVGPDGVEADVARIDGRVRLSARYLVGCDGQASTVRRLAGFRLSGTGAIRELLRADVAGVAIPERHFERLPAGLANAARRPSGVSRIMVHASGATPVARAGQVDFAEVARTWAMVTGEDISGGTAIWADAFTDACGQAARYRNGRVLLAGDAAHVQPPIGGQGLNLGLHDAVNLGWKLAAQQRTLAPAGLLDSFHSERHPVGARALRYIRAQAQLLFGGQETERARALTRQLIGNHHDQPEEQHG